MIRIGRLPCWIRLLLALFASGWVALAAGPAGAQAPADGDAARLEARFGVEVGAQKPVDRNFVTETVGAPRGGPLAGEALEARTHAVALLLRCPVCQGSAVADSPSSTAINMKNEVRDLLALGYDQEQVLRWFEAAYGQFVLMEPKAEGLNLLVWIGPGLLLVAGLAVIGATLRKRGGAQPAAGGGVPSRGELPDDPELAGWVRRVRELAYGWPNGEPPASGGA